METAILMVTAMILASPLIGYMRATAWAAKEGLVRKEGSENGSVAMELH